MFSRMVSIDTSVESDASFVGVPGLPILAIGSTMSPYSQPSGPQAKPLAKL